MPFAQRSEIFASLGADIIEKFNNNFLSFSSANLDIHVNVATSWVIHNGLSVSVSGQFAVDEHAGFVSVAEFLQGPLKEGFFAAYVSYTINVNNWTALMLIECSFLLILQLFKILVPLVGKERKHIRLDYLRVILLQFLNACLALVE